MTAQLNKPAPPTVQKPWTPAPNELLLATIVALSDRMPVTGNSSKNHSLRLKIDAIFVHGAPARDNQLDAMLLDSVLGEYYEAYEERPEESQPRILLNGLTQAECRAKNLAYDGFESYQEYLLDHDVRPDDIVILPKAIHTAAEDREMLKKSREAGWERIIIASHPHHQLRCFLTAIAMMAEADFWPLVYNLTHRGIPWDFSMVKPVLTGGGDDVKGTMADHVQAEFDRIVKYAQPLVPGGEKYTPHAKLDEMFAYLNVRARTEKQLDQQEA